MTSKRAETTAKTILALERQPGIDPFIQLCGSRECDVVGHFISWADLRAVARAAKRRGKA